MYGGFVPSFSERGMIVKDEHAAKARELSLLVMLISNTLVYLGT
jgi:hypothetical protein